MVDYQIIVEEKKCIPILEIFELAINSHHDLDFTELW